MKYFGEILLKLRQKLFLGGFKIPALVVISIGLWLSYAFLRPKSSIEDSGRILPLCTQHILDKRFYHYSFNSRNVAMEPIQDPPCRLLHYQEAETVQCFDNLLNGMKMKKSTGLLDDGEVTLTFVGDSRMRQLFAERLKVLPFLDEAIYNSNQHKHADYRTSAPIFDKHLILDFKWRPFMTNNSLIQFITEWADGPINTTYKVIPHLLLLGVSPWYMIEMADLTHLDYERHLMEIYPVLERLSLRMKEKSNGKIVWMMQYPSLIDHVNMETYRPVNDNTVKITTAKLDNYNSIARRIFRNSSVVQIWDTFLPIMEDHIRACMTLNRYVSFFQAGYWINCNDVIHAGYVAYTQTFQFLLNDLCNGIMGQ